MTTVIECNKGHYEVQEISYGKYYIWCHGCVVVECDCGERPVLSVNETVCSCGREHASLVWEVLAFSQASGRIAHPWDAEYDEWRRKKDEYLLSEEPYQRELSGLD